MKKIFSFLMLIGLISFLNTQVYSQDYPSEQNQSNTTLQPINVQSNTTLDGDSDPRVIATVIPTNGSTSGNGRAPQGSRLFINTKYLVQGSEMTASGFGGNFITSVGWTWFATTAQSVGTTGTLKVHVRDTSGTATSIGSNIFNISGMTKIIDGMISIPAGPGPYSIDVPVGGPGTSPFAPTPGNGLLIAFEYNTITPLATPVGAPTVACVNFPTNSCMTYQSQTVNGTTGAFTAFRPETRLGNTKVDVYAISNIYALGKVPTPWGCPDTLCYRLRRFIFNPEPIKIRIRIINLAPNPGFVKFDTNFFFQRPDGQPFDTLLAFVRPWNIPGWKCDSIIVEAFPKPGEDIIINNRLSWRQLITCDAWNWAEKDTPPNGGVGFNGAVGTFVACFRNNCPIPLPLWAVDLCFFNLAGAGNQPYRVYIFGDGGGSSPGPIIYKSGMLLTPPGTATPPQRVQHVIDPPVPIPPNSRFYVGVVQKGIVNLAACYQTESPVKTGRFFFTGDTSGVGAVWTDFGPNTAPFRMDICPRTTTRLFMRTFLEGFYNGTTMVSDRIQVQVRNAAPPYTLVDSNSTIVNSNGFGIYNYCRVECDVPYYFVCRHRNHIRTWTGQPQIFDCDYQYNFTDNINKAFGQNMVFVAGAADGVGGFAFYTADVNQDCIVDATDGQLIDNDAFNFVTGYVPTDVNGDDVVDGTDAAFWDNNAFNFIGCIEP